MANLVIPKSDDEVRMATVTAMRKWYKELSNDYLKITTEKLLRCPVCGQWLEPGAFYVDDRFVGGHFFMCKKCVQQFVEQKRLPDDPPNETKESVQRVLFWMDLPYLDNLYEKCVQGAEDYTGVRKPRSPFGTYLSTVRGMPVYKGMKWKDSVFPGEVSANQEKARDEIVQIFGSGFTNEDYLYLQSQYDDWVARTQIDTKSQEMYVTQICLQSLDIYKDRRAGKDPSKKLETLDRLMASANLQPKQNVTSAANDALTFGQLIEKWEQEEPIPEPEPEFKDIDNIGKYIRVFFAGHLAKALGLSNAYTEEYDEYMKEYTVEKATEVEEGKSDDIYDTIFGKAGE